MTQAEDRYLELILVATASVRRGDLDGARDAVRQAVTLYRPIVEEGLHRLYAGYLDELTQALSADDALAFAAAMEPEVVALGALSSAGEQPSPFLALYDNFLFAALGEEAALAKVSQHPAAHLLLADLARRVPESETLDRALGTLAWQASEEAAQLAWKASGGADPYTRERLRRALLRQVASICCLFGRQAPSAQAALAGLPLEALAQLPRGMRFEAFQTLAESLGRLPAEQLEPLYGTFLACVLEAEQSGPLLRRHAPAIARVAAPFLGVLPAASGYLLQLVDWFVSEADPLAEGAGEEAVRTFAKPLAKLGGRAAGPLEAMGAWASQAAPSAVPIVIAAWASATGASPGALEPRWAETPAVAWAVVREGTQDERAGWATEALAGWDLPSFLYGDPKDQLAVAELLACQPRPLEHENLARLATALVRGTPPEGPFARTLDLLGPRVPTHVLAVLLQARLATAGYVASEHDEALKQIVAWALEDGPAPALRLARGFANRNLVSWLLGGLIADGRAPELPEQEVDALAPHPFLLGAYALETEWQSV